MNEQHQSSGIHLRSHAASPASPACPKLSILFIREFFNFLEEAGIRASVLHGWQDGFEGDVSDIDFTIEPDGFDKIASLVEAYCKKKGWMLCQVLRHEPTAAFCVCTAVDDTSRSVALDACSDYCREGVLLMDSESLLRDRVKLPWGGYRLADETELEYRMLKAAAKKKEPISATEEFSARPAEVRKAVEARLADKWQVSSGDGSEKAMAKMLRDLRSRFREKRSRLNLGEIGRVVSRILHPTGMLVVTGGDRLAEVQEVFSQAFLPLHFRNAAWANEWRPTMVAKLIRTTLVFVSSPSSGWLSLVPADCKFVLGDGEAPHDAVDRLAKQLENRCCTREATTATED
ncbi:MAG: hypothetical protein EON58_05685 [Alphaproteobacteria bacterium]|nr:MAG: hypothetical protein EON58_05685 [Alphaproteobacteria bacterium]